MITRNNAVRIGGVILVLGTVLVWASMPTAGTVGLGAEPTAADGTASVQQPGADEPRAQQSNYMSGRVITQTRQAIADAEVRVPTAGEDLVDETQAGGEFNINFRGRNLPETVLMIVEKEGFTGTAALVEPGNRSIELVMLPEGKQTIEVFERSYHLGDGSYGGEINAALSDRIDGESVEKTFQVSEAQTEAELSTLFIVTKGSEAENPVYLNGQQIGVLERSDPDGSTGTQEIVFDTERLEAGENTVRFESKGSDSFFSDSDDFEVINVRARFSSVPVDDTKPSVTVDSPESVIVETSSGVTVEATDDGQVTTLVVTVWRDGEPVVHRTTSDSSLELDHRFDRPGTYDVSVQAVDQSGNFREVTRTISVGTPTPTPTSTDTPTAADTPITTPTPTAESQTTIPGFGPAVALVALVIAAGLAGRRD